jgi:hypothetical protein
MAVGTIVNAILAKNRNHNWEAAAQESGKFQDRLFAAAVVVAVFLVYRPAWNGEFVLDDEASIVNISADPESLTEVKALEKQIAAKNTAFNACLVANVAPFPVKIAVTSIASIEGTSEIGSDEPYVIVTAVDLTSLVPGLECTLYGPLSMNAGESKSAGGKPFWFIDNTTGKAIPDLTKVIFIVSLMENDSGSPSVARGLVKGLATVSIAASTALPLAQRITKLKSDVDSALATPTGFPNFDDQIGTSLQFAPSKLDLVLPILGPHTRTLTFSGDGKFAVTCTITKA